MKFWKYPYAPPLLILMIAIGLCLFSCQERSIKPRETETIQKIWVRSPGQEIREMGEVRYDIKGRKVAYRYGTTHQLFQYDEQDSLMTVSHVSADGDTFKAASYFYDQEGHLILEENYTGDGLIIRTVEYTFNQSKNLIRKTVSDKYAGIQSKTFSYSAGKCVQEVRWDASIPTIWVYYFYDSLGQKVKATYTEDSISGPTYWELYKYDIQGHLIGQEEWTANGHTPDHIRQWTYDQSGNLIKAACQPEDGQGCTGRTEYLYDKESRLNSTKEYSGNKLMLETQYEWQIVNH